MLIEDLTPGDKAKVIAEALPYIQRFWDKTVEELVHTQLYQDEIGKDALSFRYLNAAGAAEFFAYETERYRQLFAELNG